MKKILIDAKTIPDMDGYGDTITVIDDGNGMVLYAGACSTCPNPANPKTAEPWQYVYGWVAPGEYKYEVFQSPKHNVCLKVNNLGKVPTRNYNVNQNGEMYAKAIEVHCGDSDHWRGSAGCLTIPPKEWNKFIAMFTIGEKGVLTIIDSVKEVHYVQVSS